VQLAQSVHDALDRDTSQRPAAERDVEALARDVERLDSVDAEADSSRLLCGERRPRLLDALGVRVEGVNVLGAVGCEAGQATVSAADVEHTFSVQPDERRDRAGLDSVRIAALDQALNAFTVVPRAPNFRALRRVSSNFERA
jgi:hypothetical protein